MLQGDWHEVGTKEDLEKKIGNGFKVREGWTETKTDTVFCTNCGAGVYRVEVWNQTGVRAELAKMLAADVYQTE